MNINPGANLQTKTQNPSKGRKNTPTKTNRNPKTEERYPTKKSQKPTLINRKSSLLRSKWNIIKILTIMICIKVSFFNLRPHLSSTLSYCLKSTKEIWSRVNIEWEKKWAIRRKKWTTGMIHQNINLNNKMSRESPPDPPNANFTPNNEKRKGLCTSSRSKMKLYCK